MEDVRKLSIDTTTNEFELIVDDLLAYVPGTKNIVRFEFERKWNFEAEKLRRRVWRPKG